MYIFIKNIIGVHIWGDRSFLYIDNSNYLEIDEVETAFALSINEEPCFEKCCELIDKRYEIGNIELVKEKMVLFIENYKDYFDLVDEYEKVSNPCLQITGREGWFFPSELIVYLSNECPLRCVHCFRGENKNRTAIDYDDLTELLDFMTQGTKNIQLTGGEPLLYKDIFKIAEKYSDCSFSITTSAYVERKIIEKIILTSNIAIVQVSLYSCFATVHDSFTGVKGSFLKTISNIEELVSGGKFVIVSAMITDDMMDSIEEYIDLCIKLKIAAIKFGRIMPLGRAINNENSITKISDYDYRDAIDEINRLGVHYKDKIYILEEKYNRIPFPDKKVFNCNAGKLCWSISESGIIFPCSLYMNKTIAMGTLRDKFSYYKLVKSEQEFDVLQKKWWKNKQEIRESFNNNVCCTNFNLK